MGRKTPPNENYPAWTESKFWSFIRSGLRAKWTRWPPKFEALNAVKKTVKGQRHRFEYQCAICLNGFKQKEVQVDHIVPCGTLKQYSDLPDFVRKLFVPSSKLRVLCKKCHNTITHSKGG